MKLVYTDIEDGDIALSNARTGELKRFSYPRGKPLRWAFDKYGILRAVSLMNSAFWKDVTTVSNWYRASATDEWEKLAEFSIKDDYWVPVYVQDAPGKLAIRSRIGRDTYALFEYDVKTHTIGEMMVGHPTLDIVLADGIDEQTVDRVVTHGMQLQQTWFDPAWARLQAAIDKALPGKINQLSGDPTKRVLIYSSSDIDPGSWYLLTIDKMSLQQIALRQPLIDPAAMHRKEIIEYPAADGLKIPAYLTRPANSTSLQPAVILIHGGPIARDSWDWDAEVQLLASRGYVVLQPQFRGSSGFGRKFEAAGFGQWGMAMQDDVTAGVQYLVREGIADPKRICIYGASYGGYAAMWGLVKTPELYRCGISFAGVSDIEYMWKDRSDSASNKVAREMMASRIGDVRIQQSQFAEVSPLRHVDKIQAPVLLMHGEKDERVPIAHGKKMKAALEAQGKQVEWHTFEEEGHGISYIRNKVDYYETLLNFLHKHIGGLPAVIEGQPDTAQHEAQ